MDSILCGLKAAGAVLRKQDTDQAQGSHSKTLELEQEHIQIVIHERIRQRRKTAKELTELKSSGHISPRTTEYLPSGELKLSIAVSVIPRPSGRR